MVLLLVGERLLVMRWFKDDGRHVYHTNHATAIPAEVSRSSTRAHRIGNLQGVLVGLSDFLVHFNQSSTVVDKHSIGIAILNVQSEDERQRFRRRRLYLLSRQPITQPQRHIFQLRCMDLQFPQTRSFVNGCGHADGLLCMMHLRVRFALPFFQRFQFLLALLDLLFRPSFEACRFELVLSRFVQHVRQLLGYHTSPLNRYPHARLVVQYRGIGAKRAVLGRRAEQKERMRTNREKGVNKPVLVVIEQIASILGIDQNIGGIRAYVEFRFARVGQLDIVENDQCSVLCRNRIELLK